MNSIGAGKRIIQVLSETGAAVATQPATDIINVSLFVAEP